MKRLIKSSHRGVPRPLVEVLTLGSKTLKKRATEVLAYFDQPRASNGPTEAINGQLEHLRGSALGFRHLTHYVTSSFLETGGFRHPNYTLNYEESIKIDHYYLWECQLPGRSESRSPAGDQTASV